MRKVCARKRRSFLQFGAIGNKFWLRTAMFCVCVATLLLWAIARRKQKLSDDLARKSSRIGGLSRAKAKCGARARVCERRSRLRSLAAIAIIFGCRRRSSSLIAARRGASPFRRGASPFHRGASPSDNRARSRSRAPERADEVGDGDPQAVTHRQRARSFAYKIRANSGAASDRGNERKTWRARSQPAPLSQSCAGAFALCAR